MAKRWYVIHTYSGYENKVKADLEHRIETYGLSDQIVDIKIPTEEVTEIKEGGKRETKESKVLPSYVLVRMEGNDDTWSFVRNTPGVTGFVGPDGKPSPQRVRQDHAPHRCARHHPDGPQAHLHLDRGRPVRACGLRPARRLRRPGLGGHARGGQDQGHAYDLWPRDPRRAHARAGCHDRVGKKGTTARPYR